MQDLEACIREGKPDQARRIAKKRLAKNPNDVDALVGMARLQALDGALDEARTTLERALRINRQHVPAKTYQAVIADLQGRHKAADVLLNVAARAEPAYGPARYNHARQLLRSGRPDDALAELDRAIGAEPENPTYGLRRAELLLMLGRDDDAEDALSRLLSAHPGLAEGWLCAARASLKRNHASQALTFLVEGLKHSPIHLQLALAAFQAAAIVGDVAFCARIADVIGQIEPKHRDLLRAVLGVLRASTPAEASLATGALDAEALPQVAEFFESIAGAFPTRRGQALVALAQSLRR